MVCVSTSGSSGSLQSPSVTAEWVRLQPVTEKQPTQTQPEMKELSES